MPRAHDGRPAGGSASAALAAACRRALAALPEFGAGEEAELLRDVAAGVAMRLDAAVIAPTHVAAAHRWSRVISGLAQAMASHLDATSVRTVAEQLLVADLGTALLECAHKVIALDGALRSAA